MAPPPSPPPAKRRRKGPAPLSALAPGVVGPVFSKRGFAGADLIVHWPEIVGPGIAKHTRPLALGWPRGGAEAGVGATLTVACVGAFALDLQQSAPVILERINRRLGWKCVARLTIKQAPMTAAAAPRRVAPPGEAETREAGRLAEGISADRLRAAVTRLGASVLARTRAQKPAPPTPR